MFASGVTTSEWIPFTPWGFYTSSRGAAAGVQQIFNRVPTRAFTVAGFFKKDASLTGARVVVRAKEAQWTRDLAAIPVTTQPGSDWTPFSQTMTLPADTDAAMVCFEVQGQGSAWLDEVTITEEPVTSDQAAHKKG